MPVITSRASENARITIDRTKCVNCGICASVCLNESMSVKNGKLELNEKTILGCYGCGQCVAACPKDAIMVEGRCLSAADFTPVTGNEKKAGFGEILNVAAARRNIRLFKDEPVSQDALNKVIEFASYAPPSITPPEVELLVLNNRQKVRDFSFDLIDCFKKKQFVLSPWLFKMFKPFMSKDRYDNFTSFLIPWMNTLAAKRDKGENWVLYDAPAVLFFYSSLPDNADVHIAATYAMLGAETLGLGSCMIGSIAPLLGMGGLALRKKYNVTSEVKSGLALILGYPKNKYRKTIKRTFKSVRYV